MIFVNTLNYFKIAIVSQYSRLIPGYKYSLSDEIKFIKLSNELVIAEFYYSRYNAKYEKLFSGVSIGTYKKLDGKWKMSEYQSVNLK